MSKVMALTIVASIAFMGLAAVIFCISVILMVIFKCGLQNML